MKGGVRLTRTDGVITLPPPQPDGQKEESEWTPSKMGIASSTQPSPVPSPVPAALPSPFGFGSGSSAFHDARATAKPPSLAPSFGQSAGEEGTLIHAVRLIVSNIVNGKDTTSMLQVVDFFDQIKKGRKKV